MKNIGIFGSTGSIGENALRIVESHPEAFRVGVLAAGSSVTRLVEQARAHRPEVLVVGRAENEAALREALGADAGSFEILSGPEGLREAARDRRLDVVLSGVTGAQGLPVSLGALEVGTRLGLANKESMVMAGPILDAMARETGCEIVPVDSEHSALFQCLASGRKEDVGRLILTASGGPFRTRPFETFGDITLAEALKHPTWDMGPKITIDSATMMNKALEIVEARWLFDVPRAQLDVVVHPQSIVHSMVLWRDGSVISQMGAPDMRVPIQYAFTHPARIDATLETYSPEIFNGLEFYRADTRKFPSIEMGFFAAERGGTYGAVLNAANEAAVQRFFDGEIAFVEIFEHVGRVLESHRPIETPDLAQVLDADAWAREELARC
ncbi:MAG: 1-deoxy-D-xylulose-5-phosphate reductoisomerase [Planctomycetota bacterium]